MAAFAQGMMRFFVTTPAIYCGCLCLIGNDSLVDRIEPNTQRLLRRDAPLIDESFRASQVNRDLFMQVIGVPTT